MSRVNGNGRRLPESGKVQYSIPQNWQETLLQDAGLRLDLLYSPL